MNYFISGGAKNGKSSFAEDIAVQMAKQKKLPLYYVATMVPHDEEDRARIARHRRERAGKGFETIEIGYNLFDALGGKRGVYLVDSVTALLANEMFCSDGSVKHDAPYIVADNLAELTRFNRNMIYVSDYIYSDGIDYGELTEEYKRGLAHIDRVLAELCDEVVEVAFGFKTFYKHEKMTMGH